MAQSPANAVDLILGAGDRFGVLGRDVPVRLVNFSASGCLLEGTSALEPQSVGRLKVEFEGERYGDDVRVARCQEVPGGSLYNIGVEFVWTSHPDRASLRRFLRTRFLLPASGGRSPSEGREVWANGQPNGTRGAPPQRRAERVDV